MAGAFHLTPVSRKLQRATLFAPSSTGEGENPRAGRLGVR